MLTAGRHVPMEISFITAESIAGYTTGGHGVYIYKINVLGLPNCSKRIEQLKRDSLATVQDGIRSEGI